ncbi:MAG: TrlF family AAA-like ATPase [Brevundimonas sp.]|uniref:TrlF family AAA-like ATPase n=1 Tax=Brevundimonas sp. TaxID=1871086 RepID=UPI00391DF873
MIERGSEWRRWDLHVHTPGTAMNDQFKGDWDSYLAAVEAEEDVKVIGVTDYMSVTNYSRLLALKKSGRLANIELLIPNIEFRVTPETSKAKAINLHLLIDPADPNHEAEILKALGRLVFKLDGVKYGCVPADLMAMGYKHNPVIKDDGAALRHGTEQFKIGFADFRAWLDDEQWLKANALVAVANSGQDGVSGLPLDGGFAAVREQILKAAHIVFSGNPVDRLFYLGEAGAEKLKALARLGGRKPCMHGSDAHELAKLFKPDQDRFCWIKADCTFEGLRQTLFEPADRVAIGALPPVLHDEARVIDTIFVRDPSSWFGQTSLPLNQGLVAVIGQKGSGKSALAEVIASTAGSWSDSEATGFLSRSEHHLDGVEVELLWADGHTTREKIGENESDSQQVRYLSQRFVERLCAEDHVGAALVQEVESVIFAALDPTETLNASNFAELRAMHTEHLRQERERLAGRLQQLIRELAHFRERAAKVPDLKARIDTLKAEDAGLRQQLPVINDPEQTALNAQIAATRDSLVQLQAQSASDKQRLVRIDAVEAELKSRAAEMQRWHAGMVERLREIGIGDEELQLFEPVFRGDVQKPVARIRGIVETSIAQREGALEMPAAGTIRAVAADLTRLSALATADKALRDRIDAIQKRLSAIAVEVHRIGEDIARIESVERKRAQEVPVERRETYTKVFENLAAEAAILQKLYGPVRQRLETGGHQEQSLEFYIRWDVDTAAWIARGRALFDQRRETPVDLEAVAKRDLSPAWRSGNPEKIAAAITDFVEPFLAGFKNDAIHLRTGVGASDVLDWLFSTGHIRLTYGLRYNGVDLEKLSPGTKGIVLLILYLGMDTDDSRPLIIDQPEENLDSESIFDLLVHYFRAAKKRRQIILITHNPNLVVNTDAEQVVVATCGRQADGLPMISYIAGSLESNEGGDGIRSKVCRILEGGERAFHAREQRYALSGVPAPLPL